MPDFKISYLPLESTGCFEKTIISYINADPALQNLYTYEPSLNGFKERIKAGINSGTDRKVLFQIFKDQYSNSSKGLNSKVESNIELLLEDKTFTVTTGHQLNVFSGPLYVLFKLISTINLSERLKKEFPENNFIPIYWMATEDHDIAEINHISLFNNNYSFETNYNGKAGSMSLETLEPFLISVQNVLGESPLAKELSSLISEAYSNSKTLSEATHKWVDSLLGKYGLLILDADQIALKKLFIPTLKNELQNQFVSANVERAISKIQKDFPIQVNPRELNLFYILNDSRNRIVKEGGIFKVLNTDLEFSEEKILEEVENHPERFSPNVLLRPIYQELILPNIAYVGGPSEIAYWLELKFVFEALNMKLPVLLLRNCAMILDQSSVLKWKNLGFEIEQVFNDENILVKDLLVRKNDSQFSLDQSANQIGQLFDQIREQVASIDPTLKATADSEKQKSLNSLKLIEDKVIRSLKRKDETEINQLKKIKEKFLPDGSLQERKETLIPFYLKYGSEFIDELKKNFDPFNFRFMLIEEN